MGFSFTGEEDVVIEQHLQSIEIRDNVVNRRASINRVENSFYDDETN